MVVRFWQDRRPCFPGEHHLVQPKYRSFNRGDTDMNVSILEQQRADASWESWIALADSSEIQVAYEGMAVGLQSEVPHAPVEYAP